MTGWCGMFEQGLALAVVADETFRLVSELEATLGGIFQLAGKMIVPPSLVKDDQHNKPQYCLPDWIRVEKWKKKDFLPNSG